MRGSKVAARYARAFFQDALARNAVDQAAADLALLKAVWQANPEVVALLGNPLIPPERKRELCREALATVVRAEQRQFLDLLIERRRVGLLPEVHDLFQELVDDHRSVVRAEVCSAAPLTEAETLALRGAVAQVFGGTPVLETRVQPELIGGVTVRVKDAVLDGSVRKSLDMLAARLKAVALDVSAFDEATQD